MSAAASIMELLMQSWGNKIRIFPSLPESWKEASFDKLRAQGGFLVSASLTDSKTQWVYVKSLAGEPCIIKVPGWEKAYQVSSGARFKIESLGNNEFLVNLKKGDEIILSSLPKLDQIIVSQINHPSNEKNGYGVKTSKQIPINQNHKEPSSNYWNDSLKKQYRLGMKLIQFSRSILSADMQVDQTQFH